MGSSQHRNRKRGVRASREKLYHALTAAGLKTQAALAERMADLEQLDAVPKDIVNRVFRELPVELQTLERVARALDTEAFRLYKTADEMNGEPGATHDPAHAAGVPTSADPRRFLLRRRPVLLAALLAIVGLGLVLQWAATTESGQRALTTVTSQLPAAASLGLGRPSVVVLPLKNDEDGRLTRALREELGRYFSVAAETAAVLTQSLDPAEAARRLRADVTVDGDLVTIARFSGARFYLYARGVRQQIWAESVAAVDLDDHIEDIAHNAVIAVRHAVGLPVPDGEANRHYPLAPVQDEYLQGRMHLDRPSNELNIKRAQSRFEAALRQDANYAHAHAGLCETLLLEHWMSDEQRALNDAARTCGQALQLRPHDAVVNVAYAHFLRLTGRMDEAIETYQRVLEQNPRDADALSGLAETRLHAYRQSGDETVLNQAMDAARAAADADPLFWKPLYSLAPMHYFAGDVPAAIAISEEALTRDVNEYLLANLGTFYFCNGNLEKARDSYVRARNVAPQSYVGDEFLGMVYYFLGDFEHSAELRRRAIDSVAVGSPEIHEMWGNLADSYRQAGKLEPAVMAYLQAAEIVERDFLRGTATESGRAARAYYYTMLQKLAPGRVPPAVDQSIDAELDAVSATLTESNALLRLAQAWLQRDEPTKARAALEQVVSRCVGYGAMPDLVALQD